LAAGTLSADLRIDSSYLGYALQYRVYVPESTGESHDLPTIYVTDGQWYLDQGHMVDVLDEQISQETIEPVVAIFVDSRNPDDLSENRRNKQFMCNRAYLEFYLNELIPTITANYPVSDSRNKRVIAGVSFGGLNAACFGLMASNTFGGMGMHSPASSGHLKLLNKLYKENRPERLAVFFSVGTKNDNTRAARSFHRTLEDKGYDVNYIEVPFGHEWSNWRPLIDDLLLTFYRKQ
jgi:enterochelin esterase-like enzyme